MTDAATTDVAALGPMYPSIPLGSAIPSAAEPPPAVDDCSALEPNGVQVLAAICPGEIAVDDDWVYVARASRPGRDGSGTLGPLVRVPRCGGDQGELVPEAWTPPQLLSANGVLYRLGAGSVERIAKTDGSVTPLPADCARSIAVNATYVFAVDTCSGKLLRAPHDGTAFETIVQGFAAGGGQPPMAATDSFVYWEVLDQIVRAPVDGGGIELAFDMKGHWTTSLLAGDAAVYVLEGADPGTAPPVEQPLVRIPEDPQYSLVRASFRDADHMDVDQGFLYLGGARGFSRIRATDLGGAMTMGDTAIPSSGMVVRRDRLYYCDGDSLVTRRASVPPLSQAQPRPSSVLFDIPPPSGLIFQLGAGTDAAGNLYLTALEPPASLGGQDQGYLLKLDPSGAELRRTPLPLFATWFFDVDPLGNAVVVSEGYGTARALTKYRSDGSLAWQRSLFNLSPVRLDGQGNVLMLGTAADGGALAGIIGFDPNGNDLPFQALPGGGNLQYNSPPVHAGGSFLMTGSVTADVDLGGGMIGAAGNAFVMRLDASFRATWFRPLAQAQGTIVSGFPDGGFLFAGWGQPGADFGAGPVTGAPSAHYRCVVRYDGTGAVSWQRIWSDDIQGGGMFAASTDGSTFALGTGAGLSAVAGSWLSIPGFYIVKLDPAGGFLWAEDLNALRPLRATLTADPTGHAILVDANAGISPDFIAKFAP